MMGFKLVRKKNVKDLRNTKIKLNKNKNNCVFNVVVKKLHNYLRLR